jgi:hypothetical protein
MARKWWFTAATALVTATLYRNRLRAYLEQASANVRAFDLPSARAYDAQVASILEGLGSGSSVLGNQWPDGVHRLGATQAIRHLGGAS